jgi:hypothetical protein
VTHQELLDTLRALFAESPWPKPLHVLQAAELVHQGMSPAEAARSVGTTTAQVRRALAASDPAEEILGLSLHGIDLEHRQGAAQMLGQLLLGRCAEVAFEEIYRAEIHTEELHLRDLREGRTDTDYRVYNGRGRPMYRINIKFHGSAFRRAKELVGLEPEDCFALATYKIYGALQKQSSEAIPYFFAVVGVPNLTGESVGRSIPSVLVEASAFIDQAPRGKGKRELEDAVVRHLATRRHTLYLRTLEQITEAEWYILSAKRADRLLRSLLFDRAFALRVRNFARAFRGAELDMHFSLRNDLTPLRQFLRTLRDEGPQKITTLLERGDY